jgi:hypothetical protein
MEYFFPAFMGDSTHLTVHMADWKRRNQAQTSIFFPALFREIFVMGKRLP